ncbi:hypothetical protein Ngar_c26030 [Candidatus Nitrososphaera gargensis Ga9.2]|uniref:Uncharacterized protein n=1 Tax=Nitrososphaera gargensis (strain Ga9.2) TaxID=1237085 RepID=K0IHV9_NITGG|nr:hypothetical protein Ngar_c26030 [Candidatus Nitrososphaera gargensis Ga9.2]
MLVGPSFVCNQVASKTVLCLHWNLEPRTSSGTVEQYTTAAIKSHIKMEISTLAETPNRWVLTKEARPN